MAKRIFITIVVLMSISLIGIISVQLYWIKDAIKTKQQQFDNDVTIALAKTSERIKEREYKEFLLNHESFLKFTLWLTYESKPKQRTRQMN